MYERRHTGGNDNDQDEDPEKKGHMILYSR